MGLPRRGPDDLTIRSNFFIPIDPVGRRDWRQAVTSSILFIPFPGEERDDDLKSSGFVTGIAIDDRQGPFLGPLGILEDREVSAALIEIFDADRMFQAACQKRHAHNFRLLGSDKKLSCAKQ